MLKKEKKISSQKKVKVILKGGHMNKAKTKKIAEPLVAYEVNGSDNKAVSNYLEIGFEKTCRCGGNNINCLTAKEWMKNQLGVWEFYYEKRDVRDKELHPATFPISMARRVIELFSHQGELVLDPFVGNGTTLVAAQDTNRNAVGFDLQQKYIDLSKMRLSNEQLFNTSKQIEIVNYAKNIHPYLKPQTVKLIWISPSYVNFLNN
jgi:DNA modification methylase